MEKKHRIHIKIDDLFNSLIIKFEDKSNLTKTKILELSSQEYIKRNAPEIYEEVYNGTDW